MSTSNAASTLPPDIGKKLHSLWQGIAAVPTPYMTTFGFAWERWAFEVDKAIRQAGWNTNPEELLCAVLRWRKRRAKESRAIAAAWTGLKKISHFPEDCVSDYAEIRAESRAVPGRTAARSDKARVLQATGRPAAAPAPAPAATPEVIARLLAELKASTRGGPPGASGAPASDREGVLRPA